MYDHNEINYKSKKNIRDNSEVYTPMIIVDAMLDGLPSTIWTEDYIFIEPTCGNGNFLVQMAKKMLLSNVNIDEIISKLIGLDISDSNIIDCKTRLSKLLNVPALRFNETIVKVDDSLEILADKSSFLYSKISNKKIVVVGNPPYSKPHSDKGNVYDTIYNLFVQSIIDNINPDYFTFIIPSKWMIGGKGLDEFREYMMKKHTIKEIHHFGGKKEVFPDVEIPCGVNYFLIEKDYDGSCEMTSSGISKSRYLDKYDIILIDNNAVNILEKVIPLTNSATKLCQSISIFGLPTNFNKFTTTGLKCLCKGTGYNEKTYKYVDPRSIKDKKKLVGKWKVCTATVNGGARNEANYGTKRIFGDIIILEPDEVSTYTFIIVACFDTKEEAENYVKYMKTKFYRFMLGLRAITPILNKEKFIWVPDMGNYTIEYTDQYLYNKYNLTQDEINYIESKIEII